jgi:hypothetical protein
MDSGPAAHARNEMAGVKCILYSHAQNFRFVIPGRASWREPGIYNHGIKFEARWSGSHVQHQHWWLWIPGSMLRIAPE